MKKVIIWTTGIDDLYSGTGKVGGLTVQMSFWANIFFEKKWEVYSFSKTKSSKSESITFLKFPEIKYIGIFIEIFLSLFYILKIRPEIIFYRGGSRSLSYLSVFSKITKTKLVFFGASDVNFVPGKELISGSKLNKTIYRWGLKNIDYCVVQNNFQKEQLYINYKKTSILIPNIWISQKIDSLKNNEEVFVLWVGNFRKLKRPEWFINLSKKYSNIKFIMVGGEGGDLEFYNICQNRASEISNLDFLGNLSFQEVNILFSKAKVFVCTSEFEGFPNTFLQSWANKIPVVTTVDPSDLLKTNYLGLVVKEENELAIAINELLDNNNLYRNLQNKIEDYFKENHSVYSYFDILIDYINKR